MLVLITLLTGPMEHNGESRVGGIASVGLATRVSHISRTPAWSCQTNLFADTHSFHSVFLASAAIILCLG